MAASIIAPIATGLLGSLLGKKQKTFQPLGEAGLTQQFGQSAFGAINELSFKGKQLEQGIGVINPELFKNLETQGTQKLAENLAGSRQSLQNIASQRGITDSGIVQGQQQALLGGFTGNVTDLLSQLQNAKLQQLGQARTQGINLQTQAEQLRGQRIGQLNNLLAQGISSENQAIAQSNQAISNIASTISASVVDFFDPVQKLKQRFLNAKTLQAEKIAGI